MFGLASTHCLLEFSISGVQSRYWGETSASIPQKWNVILVQCLLYATKSINSLKRKKKNILAIFRNYSLLKGSKPIILPQWFDKGAHSIQDIMGLQGLREFHDYKNLYNLPGTSLFLSAMTITMNNKLLITKNKISVKNILYLFYLFLFFTRISQKTLTIENKSTIKLLFITQ